MNRTSLVFATLLTCSFASASLPAQAQKKGLFGWLARQFTNAPSIGVDANQNDSTSTGAEALAAGEIDTLKLSSDALPYLGLEADKRKKKEKESKKKIKEKKTIFYGLKTRKNFTKSGNGDRQTIELFYTLREYQAPNSYLRHAYWYDPQNRKITDAAIKDKETAQILHGPYQKIVGGKVMEQGFYYLGGKHGRWEKYKSDNTLVDKTKFLRGFPKEAEISYYDAQKTKIKEVLPKEYGQVRGEYFRYYEGGQLACEGRFDNGVKVGRWMDYYPFRRQRKKETLYGKSAAEVGFEPHVVREWDEKGKVLFDKERGIDNLANREPAPEESEAPVTKKTTANQGREDHPPAGKKADNPAEGTGSPAAVGKETPAPPTPAKKFDNRTRPGARRRGQ
ncbi:MAG: hypothetical protein H7Z75_04580 [Ferruginibacter sp.]|nr:hypothetical protein [Cytophagales bacterium]